MHAQFFGEPAREKKSGDVSPREEGAEKSRKSRKVSQVYVFTNDFMRDFGNTKSRKVPQSPAVQYNYL